MTSLASMVTPMLPPPPTPTSAKPEDEPEAELSPAQRARLLQMSELGPGHLELLEDLATEWEEHEDKPRQQLRASENYTLELIPEGTGSKRKLSDEVAGCTAVLVTKRVHCIPTSA